MEEKGEGGIAIIVILALLIGGGGLYWNNRQKKIEHCAIRTQDAYLQAHYGQDRYKLPLSELTKTYQVAEADCGG